MKQTFLPQALTCTRRYFPSAEATALPAFQGLGCTLLCLVLTTTLRPWQRDKSSLSSRCLCPSRNKIPPVWDSQSFHSRKPDTYKEGDRQVGGSEGQQGGIKSGAESTRHWMALAKLLRGEARGPRSPHGFGLF